MLFQYVRGLKNFKAEQPHQHAVYYTTVLMSEQLWTKDELLDATEGIFNFNLYFVIWNIDFGNGLSFSNI